MVIIITYNEYPIYICPDSVTNSKLIQQNPILNILHILLYMWVTGRILNTYIEKSTRHYFTSTELTKSQNMPTPYQYIK